jgi:hypothetical protein
MAADINPGGDPVIRPGDSIVVDCASPTGGGIAEDGGGPRVYMHVRCAYIGTWWPTEAVKPDLAGPELEGTYGHYVSDDGTWTIIQGDTAVSYAGVPVPGRYMFDLNDSLLTQGYMLEYYFEAYDNDGNSTTLPADAESVAPHPMPGASHLFEFTCLPLLNSRMLYVDDYDGIGCRDGVVHVYFDRTISAMDEGVGPPNPGCIPERYDINGPTSLVSNGLASRARLSHLLDGYGAIIWDSGDLASGTITDGSTDKCDDCSFLAEWLDSLQRDLYGIWILGTDVAEDLTALGSPQALALMGDWCGVTLEHGSYYGLTGGYGGGGIVNPKVTAIPYDPSSINPFWHTTWGDSIYAFGGCPGIRSFDVLGATANGIPVLKYPEFGGGDRYAAIAATDTNSLGFEVKTMWFGFSFMHMRDCWEGHTPSIPIMSTQMYREVMRFHINIGCSPSDLTHNDDVPAVNTLLQNHPNPFNPLTMIRFSLARPGHASLVIYDVTGRRVRTLVDGSRDAGAHAVTWDGTNDRGAHVASGVYFYRLYAAGFERTRKMVLLR